MGHHHHPHGHHHDHSHHEHHGSTDLPELLDTSIPDSELDPKKVSRRGMLRSAGLLGAAVAAGSVLQGQGTAAAEDSGGAATTETNSGGYQWLTGDHHIHTQYSPDGKYRVIDQVRQGHLHGLDWMVITDHGYDAHVKIGVDKINPEIRTARQEYPRALVFHGLEWNIPAAEHGTVIIPPSSQEVSVLKDFELAYDGLVNRATSSTPTNEALAIAGVNWLADAVRAKRIQDALFVANHPARRGIDSPHELRAWRDTAPHIAVGMEAAPGHQAAGIPKPLGPGQARGPYGMEPTVDSFPDYPAECYRTHGGFDWMTSTVGGLWDSLLAEGKPWWITANSDSHTVYADTTKVGPGSDFATNGKLNDPVYSGTLDLDGVDFWPGQYTRTHVGADSFGYLAVMAGIRAGRVWVDHGALLKDLNIRARGGGRLAGLGGTLTVARGTSVDLVMDITPANRPNWAGFVPKLAKVDVIQGAVTGPVRDKDTFTTPRTRVVKSYDASTQTGAFRLVYSLGPVEEPLYLRVRGSDGNRTVPGLMGADVDPAGPAQDVVADADPWLDLWFYANPIFVVPV